MHKNLITSILLISTLYFSCSKSKQPNPQNSASNAVKIELVSGGNQTDTVGRQLANPIVVKVTQNGTPLSGYEVQFQGSGCNNDRLNIGSTKSDGTISYNWSLSGDVGPQTLKIYALKSQNVKVDSVTATSTGLAPDPGWHSSACSIQGGAIPASFCKLTTGRLFVCYGGLGLRYSDDNGISWNLVKNFAGNSNPRFVVSSPTDELFVFTQVNGIFYSNDSGVTWTTLTTPPFNSGSIISAVCTFSGKLLVTNIQTIYISLDKGKTWITPPNKFVPPNSGGGGDSQINSPTEDKSGNLYCVGQESETIYKSIDNGNTWTPIPRPNILDFAIYIDNNNWFYVSQSEPGTGGIYISKDNGVTYTQLISSPNTFLENMSVQSDGNFYYDYLGLGVYMAKGISNSVKDLNNGQFNVPPPYIVAKNNNIIYADTGNGIIHYFTY
jgi:hypothetical protein